MDQLYDLLNLNKNVNENGWIILSPADFRTFADSDTPYSHAYPLFFC